MLGYLHSDIQGELAFTPRKVQTVGELYSFNKDEIRYGFRCYRGKTWLALNEILKDHNLPEIRLPEEYTHQDKLSR